jgi:hypothetical protein
VHGQFLDAGQLQPAAESLASAGSVAIVTGFCVLDADPPAAETDGPPGALYLARALLELGVRVQLITDCYAAPVLAAGCRYWRLPEAMLVEAPWQPDDSQAVLECAARGREWAAWCRDLAGASDWTHLIAIERPGPSHDAHGGHCHNMRGAVIDAVTAPLHALFEVAAPPPRRIKTIGMADGGNEIGVGKLAWQQVRQALADPAGERIICRVPTDWLLLAGVSNWAAYALAGCVCALRDRQALIADWSVVDHGRLIEALVREGGAVDGTTGARQPSVDGLPLAQYLSTLDAIQELLTT